MSRDTYYRKCPLCGANLDPGERCDCKDLIVEAEPIVEEEESINDNDLRQCARG